MFIFQYSLIKLQTILKTFLMPIMKFKSISCHCKKVKTLKMITIKISKTV